MENAYAAMLRTIIQGLDVVGDRWALLILREAFYGCNRFEQFRQNTGISRATLTRRLNDLVDNDVLYKRPLGSSKRVEYNFTARGLGLFGASLLAQDLENQWREEGDPESPVTVHTVCQQPFKPKAVCRHCRMELKPEDIQWQRIESGYSELIELGNSGNSRRTRDSHSGKSSRVASLIGDRWTLLILIACFLGTTRFDDFGQQLNIAPGILTERLKSLMSAGLMSRETYSSNPPRYEYTLTPKGHASYTFVIALRQWILEGCRDELPAANMIHGPCEQPLKQEIVCGHCEQKPWPRDVVIKNN